MKKLMLVILLAAVAVGGFLYLQQPVEGVRSIVWDKAECAHCHMHIGNPHYAAQLQTKDGRILDFDDPGCLFEWVTDHTPRIKTAYFHHYQKDQWLDFQEVGFIRVDEETPMGYGLGAVDKAAHPDAMDFGEASRVVLEMGDDRTDKPAAKSPTSQHQGDHR